MINRRRIIILLSALIILMGTAPIFLYAQSSLEKGVVLYQKENYDEALLQLKKARQEDPASTRAAFYLGLTYKKMEDYKSARIHLEDAMSRDPKIKEALLELVEVLYQLNRLNEAKKWIAVSEALAYKPAQTTFLKGMVLAKAGDNDTALTAFAKSEELDSKLKQAADYQIGMIHLAQKRMDTAQKAFQDVLSVDPNSDLAVYADEYMKAIARRQEAEKNFRGSAGVFAEFDTNVILEPADLPSVEILSDQKDWREVVTSSLEYIKRYGQTFDLRFQYNFYLANEQDLCDYNMHSHTWGIVPNWYHERVVLSVPMQYNYTWVAHKAFLSTFYATPMFSAQLSSSQMAQASCRIQGLDYLRSTTPDENRTGPRVVPGAAWFYFYAQNKGFVSLRYEMDITMARGNNWDYLGNRLNASVVIPIFDRLKVTQVGDLFIQGFDHTHSVYDEKRDDVVWTFSTLLGYTIVKNLEAQLRYTYVKDNANIRLYNYNRDVFSMGMVYQF